MSWPKSSNRCRTLALVNASTIALLILAMISVGVPLGAHSPLQQGGVDSRRATLVDRRNIDGMRPACLGHDRESLDLAIADVGDGSSGPVHFQIDVTRYQVLYCGSLATVGNKLKVRPG